MFKEEIKLFPTSLNFIIQSRAIVQPNNKDPKYQSENSFITFKHSVRLRKIHTRCKGICIKFKLFFIYNYELQKITL